MEASGAAVEERSEVAGEFALSPAGLGRLQGVGDQDLHIIAPVMMVLILSLVFVLVTDLERSQQGLMQISQQPLIALQQQLQMLP